MQFLYFYISDASRISVELFIISIVYVCVVYIYKVMVFYWKKKNLNRCAWLTVRFEWRRPAMVRSPTGWPSSVNCCCASLGFRSCWPHSTWPSAITVTCPLARYATDTKLWPNQTSQLAIKIKKRRHTTTHHLSRRPNSLINELALEVGGGGSRRISVVCSSTSRRRLCCCCVSRERDLKVLCGWQSVGLDSWLDSCLISLQKRRIYRVVIVVE